MKGPCDVEIGLMKIEAFLDRIQNDLRRAIDKGKMNLILRAKSQALKALGVTRSIMEYHSPYGQMTLKMYGCKAGWEQHVARQRA